VLQLLSDSLTFFDYFGIRADAARTIERKHLCEPNQRGAEENDWCVTTDAESRGLAGVSRREKILAFSWCVGAFHGSPKI
jgi:hypothetical protein